MTEPTENIRKQPNTFLGLNVEANPWVLIPSAAAMILFNNIVFIFLFWLRFGVINEFIFGFCLLFTAAQILGIVGARFSRQDDYHAQKSTGSWTDYIGAWWLLACFLGPAFGWFCEMLADSFSDNWQAFHYAKVFFTIFLPVFTMLPLVRYVKGKAATIQIPMLFLVTLLPVFFGLNSVIGLWNNVQP
jgi:hypothetical protein